MLDRPPFHGFPPVASPEAAAEENEKSGRSRKILVLARKNGYITDEQIDALKEAQKSVRFQEGIDFGEMRQAWGMSQVEFWRLFGVDQSIGSVIERRGKRFSVHADLLLGAILMGYLSLSQVDECVETIERSVRYYQVGI